MENEKWKMENGKWFSALKVPVSRVSNIMIVFTAAEGNVCGARHRVTMIEPTPLIRETEAISPGAFLQR